MAVENDGQFEVHRLGELLERSGRSIGVAESLTGGLLVQALARQVGSGEWLAGGIVAYQRSVKHDLLGVRVNKVVSRQAAAEMATSVRQRLGCDVGLAVTGVAGPDWQDGERPGTVWIAVDLGNGAVTALVHVESEDPGEICCLAVVEATLLATRELESPRDDNPRALDAERSGPVRRGPRKFVRDNALSVACFSLFAAFLAAQSLTGWRASLADALGHGGASFGYWHYLTTAHFAEATFENWESEFLQMGAFVLLTIFLIQKGSSESKQEIGNDPRDEDPRQHRADPGAPWPVRRGGWWLVAYENSLLIAFTVLFAASFLGHAVSGAHEYTVEQHEHGALGVGAWQFARTSQFWFQSFQNWQSEFLAVGSIVLLSVFLRQRGSAESKPVHVAHATTGD